MCFLPLGRELGTWTDGENEAKGMRYMMTMGGLFWDEDQSCVGIAFNVDGL